MSTIFKKLLNWKYKKKLQFDLIYRYVYNKSDVIEKKSAAVKTVLIIIIHSDKTLNNRFISFVEISTNSNLIERLFNVQTAENKINFIIVIKRDIRARWKCVKKNYNNQNYFESTYYIKDSRKYYFISSQNLTSWSIIILKNRIDKLIVDQSFINLIIV